MMFFISQPMRGREFRDILKERSNIRYILESKGHRACGFNFEELSKYESAYSLGISIQSLATCDAAVFADGWSDARGCKIEWLVCQWYDIPIYYADLDREEVYPDA